MPKLPSIKAAEIVNILKKKGFVLNRVHGSHHVYVRSSDKLTVVVPVHKGRDLGKGLALAILKDAQITIEEFLKLH